MRPLAAIGAILVLAGLLLSTASMSDADRISRYGESPERISLKALIERGRGGPKNVIITDYVPCENYLARELRQVHLNQSTSRSRLLSAYVPVVPAVKGLDGQLDRRPRQVHVLLYCDSVADEEDMLRQCRGPEVQGLVVGTASEFDRETRDLLTNMYADTRLDQCLVVNVGEKVRPLGTPSRVSRIGTWVMYAGCVLLGIAAILWMERAGRAVYYTVNKPKGTAPSDAGVPPPEPVPPTGSP